MTVPLVRWTLLTVFWTATCGELVYRWEKTRILPQMGLDDWRPTSFAMTKEKMFLSLVDVGKEVSGNGVVAAFNMSSSVSPDVSVFPFQNFYKINDPERGKVTTPMALRTDDCERLWVLDSAVQNISGIQTKTNPAIYVFNTRNSQLVRSFNVPASQWSATTFFVNFVVATDGVAHDCEESFGYFADFNRFHLLAYDFLRNRSELKSHPFFSPDPLVHTPDAVLFNAAHQDLNGIFGLALVEGRSPGAADALYFHPLAATREFRIEGAALRAEGNFRYGDVEVLEDKGEGAEAGASAYDPESRTVFFAEVNSRKIGGLPLEGGVASGYSRYDSKLESGRIVDLVVRHSQLWLLVDDAAHVAVHRVPVAEVNEESSRERKTPPPQQPSSSGSRAVLPLGLLSLAAVAFVL